MRARLLVAAVLVATGAWAAPEETPDAQLLLDLELLSQAEPHERDLMRRLGLVERLRMLEIYRMFDPAPARRAPARPADGPPVDPGRR